MIYFNFPGQYSIEFGLLRKKNDPHTKNKYGLVNNLSNREIGLNATVGGFAGYQAGKGIHSLVSKSSKGGGKAGLVGAAITGGLATGTGLLLRKTKTYKNKKK